MGVSIRETSLVPMALWITPDFMPKRFATWFFVAAVVAHAEVRVDGDEIDAYRWVRPAEALAEQRASALELPPPTFVTITQLAGYPSAEAVLDELSDRTPTRFTPKICRIEEGACSLCRLRGWRRGTAGAAPSPVDRFVGLALRAQRRFKHVHVAASADTVSKARHVRRPHPPLDFSTG